MSESDVYRRQIVTYKDVPRAERINSSFTNFAFMRKLPSFTNFAFMRNPHVYITMEIFHYMHGLKSPTRIVSDMGAMLSCIFNLCDVRMLISITCIVPRVYFR